MANRKRTKTPEELRAEFLKRRRTYELVNLFLQPASACLHPVSLQHSRPRSDRMVKRLLKLADHLLFVSHL